MPCRRPRRRRATRWTYRTRGFAWRESTRRNRTRRVRPETLLPPIDGPAWGYRHRARLSVRHVPKKGGVLVGFHERKSSFVADMTECHVVPPRVSALLPKLRVLIGSLSIRDRLPQIELAIGERLSAHAEGTPPVEVVALVLRVLDP